jgi:sugar/nucleoside kinase (ribokinase family)/sugar phosphate isomerase/epimerase
MEIQLLLVLLLLWAVAISSSSTSSSTSGGSGNAAISVTPRIVVVGSINADTFLHVSRLPVEGENLTTLREPEVDLPGGKGCTQAVAAAKLLLLDPGVYSHPATTTSSSADSTVSLSRPRVAFVGQFGSQDAVTTANLMAALVDSNIDVSHCGRHVDLSCGRGYVCLAQNGQVSAVVSGGANAHGWHAAWSHLWDRYVAANRDFSVIQKELENLLPIPFNENGPAETCIVLLQREVPEYVNLLVATYCKAAARQGRRYIVLQDVGGEDRPISSEMLQLCDFILPNESELIRLCLAQSWSDQEQSTTPFSSLDINESRHLSDDEVVDLARQLQRHGARNVLVTRGRRGSTLVCEPSGSISHDHDTVWHQAAFTVDTVIDETGAGDCYRAGLAVALLETLEDTASSSPSPPPWWSLLSLATCMEFASAAGACSVTQRGAVPSTPTRARVDELLRQQRVRGETTNPPASVATNGLRGGASGESMDGDHAEDMTLSNDFPFLIGSRLNSMKDRPELWSRSTLSSPQDYVQRQASIAGLTCVDFNYPQHFVSFWSATEAKQALVEAGLVAGAVCLRYPAKFARGAMNHPDPALRQQAIQLTKEAAQVAIELGCNEVVVWSAYDGYDYPFQVDYDAKWQELVDAFRECCDAYLNIKFSLEYKPTDENTRFFTVPSTGAALLLVQEVDRSNFGLTLDVGHMLMAGENPGQSIAMVGRAGKLFGIQLNDGYTRLAAEDGLMFGSVHPGMALEIMHQLQRTNFQGHVYFDTFPQRSDPVAEAEYNIRRVKAFWKAAKQMDAPTMRNIVQAHDAVGAIEMVNEALRRM